ncbi:hypothetical protein [Pseudotabrizicola alkalilacus]|uniref:Response regulatory domain-containing protein n=1 Tax=Pseudotabrizicola alkalilacus TaxID=2305252 RepID=A0A411YX33_9RHOB|nr:hypothetical protein [Pseudotabrizicola alkalilacus]RGP35431.1 hypothetical protein D1012_20335 [Pseudotabrizicola alkalilacus]
MDRTSSESAGFGVEPAAPWYRSGGSDAASGFSGSVAENCDKIFYRTQYYDMSFPRIVALLGEPADARLANIADWVHELGGTLTIADSRVIGPGRRSEILDSFDFCLVDADLLGEVEDTVDYCLKLRKVCPDMPILLLSSEVRAHDLTAERMAICDATLRMPMARASFFEGVAAAVNNSMFRVQRARDRQEPGHA